MFIDRRLNPSNNVIELWSCRWENRKGRPARKVYLQKICDEQQVRSAAAAALSEKVVMDSSFRTPQRTLDLDAYPGCSYTVWASTPAIVWTANRPQERGIHVHVHDGSTRVVDDTFGEVVLNGVPLERSKLIEAMIARSVI